MSSRDATRPQDLGPERLNPAQGAPILDPSVEAEGRATDLCTGPAPREFARARILAWLAEGAREVTWALCWLPRERWAEAPPVGLGDWPALRHVRHVALHESTPHPSRGSPGAGRDGRRAVRLSTLEIEQADAAWDSQSPIETAEGLVRGLGETRFELFQRLEVGARWLSGSGRFRRPRPRRAAPRPPSILTGCC